MTDANEVRRLGLDDAYAVKTPEDNRALYRDWAATYEDDFIAPRGYTYHLSVVELFAQAGPNADAPVLDVGCGTGIVGVALRDAGFDVVDGIDLSPEMLEQAATKRVYRSLIEVDVTQPMSFDDDAFGGVTSVGTFTHGHLGPEPLHELVRVTQPGGVLAIGINAEHYEEHRFGAVLNDMLSAGSIVERRLERVRIYAKGDDEHADDLALVAVLRKA
jgi:predicted TPR repeat methyltransferase